MKMRINLFMLATIASFTVACTQPSFAAGEWVDLLENGLTDWQDSSGWKTADEVIVNPQRKETPHFEAGQEHCGSGNKVSGRVFAYETNARRY